MDLSIKAGSLQHWPADLSVAVRIDDQSFTKLCFPWQEGVIEVDMPVKVKLRLEHTNQPAKGSYAAVGVVFIILNMQWGAVAHKNI